MANDYIRRFSEAVHVEIEPLDGDGYTDVRRGSAIVGINVLEDHGLLMLMSRIMDLSKENQEQLYGWPLELNFLGTSDGAVATVADEWDDRLTELFSS